MLAANDAIPLLFLQPPAMVSHTALHCPRCMALSDIDVNDYKVVVALSVQSIRLHRPAAFSSLVRQARTVGSCRGTRQNKLRDFRLGVHNTMRDYFGVYGLPPMYEDADFESVGFACPECCSEESTTV